jgi:tetratricopeptide (TPR) repeat protein
MPWCPKCGTEYREGFSTCYDCGGQLVESLDDDFEGDVVDDSDLTADEIEETFSNGMSAYEDDEFEDALEYFNEVVRADIEHQEAFNMLGLTFAALDLPREAWRSFKHALRIDGNDPATLFYIADFLCDQGDYELARGFSSRHLAVEKDEEEREEMQKVVARIQQHFDAGDQGSFVADMALELEIFASACLGCKVRLPMDAPYCPVCGAIHIYPEETVEFETLEDSEDDWEDDDEAADEEPGIGDDDEFHKDKEY